MRGKCMKIAVLLSTYNGEKYLNDLLNSIYLQKCDFEVIVCIRDDGSNDNTLGIIDNWKTKLKIIITGGENLGPRGSFRELLDTAPACDYYAFCDQDDIWYPDKLAAAVSELEKGKNNIPRLYYCNTSLVDQNRKLIQGSRDTIAPLLKYENLIVENPALGCEMVFNNELREAMKKVSFKYYYMHDVVAIELAALLGEIIYDKSPKMDYRQHMESVTQGHDKIRRFFDRIDFWFFQKDISISNQAKEILNLFPMTRERDTLKEVCEYRKGLNRIKLMLNKKYRASSYRCNRSFILRVLLGVA